MFLNGVSSVTLITCLVEWVQPSSLGSREKKSWYSARRDWAEATCFGGQNSIHSGLTPQTTFLAFALWSALVPEGHGPLLMPPSNWCAQVIPALM